MFAGAGAMNRLLRKPSFLRIAAAAIGGTVLLYANDDPDTSSRISFSVPEQWHLSQYLISSISAERWQFADFAGNLPFFSSRFNLVPENNKVSSSESVGDGHKASCGCLGRDTIANAAARVAPAVVNLSVPKGFQGFRGGKSIGCGTIIDSNGTILTCAHVVNYSGLRPSSIRKIDVTLQDGRTFEGTVLNADLHSDIAIVKINSKTPLPTAKLGSSSKIRPGEWVLAVGCPLSLQNTVTMGIISCIDRKSSDLGLGGFQREYLQTDCAVNAVILKFTASNYVSMFQKMSLAIKFLTN
ncbi:Putative protease Do-like 14 [Linum grandiflorum]